VQAWNSPQFWRDLASGAGSIVKAVQTVVTVAVAAAIAGPIGAKAVIDDPDSTFAKFCGVAGQTALACTTGGASSAVAVGAAVALSAGGFVVSETHCLGDASALVGAGMEFGGCAVGLGVFSGDAAELNKLQQAAKAFEGATTVVEGAGTAIEGVANARVADFDGDAQDARADATAARERIERLQKLTQFLLDDIKDTQKSHQRAQQALQGAMTTLSQTPLTAASMTMRG
jgi:hypothetical protein